EETNTFSHLSPANLDTTYIATYLAENNGMTPLPDESDKYFLNEKGYIELDVNAIEAKVIISDLNSKPFTVTSESTTIENVSLGFWYLTLIKEGYVDQSYYIYVTSDGTYVQADLPEDFRPDTVIDG